jgi:hypothetical protein
MPAPLLAAAPYILSGISALGGIFGKKKKHMDSETLRQLYGPRAISKDTSELANYILNSPYGQQLLASAAEQGQGLQSDMAQRAAISGLSPDTGASSGASDFQVSAATQAQTGLERGVRANIYQSAMPIAADLVSGRMAAALQAQGETNADPTLMQRIGAAAGQVASDLKPPAAKTATTNAAAGTSQLAIPKVVPDPNTGAPTLGVAPQMPVLPQPNQAPSQFRGTSLTNARSGGMRRALTGGRR